MKTLLITILTASLLVETYQLRLMKPGCWTQWFDRDDPTATGDWETLDELRDENPGMICDEPLQIEVQTTSGDSVDSTGDIITVSDTVTGFVCKNCDQTKKSLCSDYRVRFMCPVEFCKPRGCWTKWFDRDDPTATGDWETLNELHNENPGKICDNPLQIEAQTTSGASVVSTGDVIALSDPSTGFVCKNVEQPDSTCEDYEVRFYCPEEFCNMKGCWTEWFDRDDPTATGDWETLENLYNEYPGKICDSPLQIEVQTTSGLSVASTGNVIAASDTSTGFVCKNSDQFGSRCQDYKVRFLCPVEFCHPRGCWTEWFDRDNPSGTGDWETLVHLSDENPGKICDSPLQIEVQTTSGLSVDSTGNVIAASDSNTGFVCKNSDQSGSVCQDYMVRFYCPEDFCQPKGCWTEWLDRDNPSGTGDWETLSYLLDENPGKLCDSPLQIEVQTTSGASVDSTGNVIAASDTNTGFVCKNSDQSGSTCEDYQVRFFCPEEFCIPNTGCWTGWFDRDDPTATGDWETLEHLRIENPGKICDNPLQINVLTTSGASVASTGDVITLSDTVLGFACKNEDQSGSMCQDYQVRFLCPEDFCSPTVCWTSWFDRDNPSGVGDWELLSDLRNENPGQICENPLDIEVQTVDSSIPAASTGQSFYASDPTQGFACRNEDQGGGFCQDYKVRFSCPCP